MWKFWPKLSAMESFLNLVIFFRINTYRTPLNGYFFKTAPTFNIRVNWLIILLFSWFIDWFIAHIYLCNSQQKYGIWNYSSWYLVKVLKIKIYNNNVYCKSPISSLLSRALFVSFDIHNPFIDVHERDRHRNLVSWDAGDWN